MMLCVTIAISLQGGRSPRSDIANRVNNLLLFHFLMPEVGVGQGSQLFEASTAEILSTGPERLLMDTEAPHGLLVPTSEFNSLMTSPREESSRKKK